MSDALKELRDIALDRLESENRSLTGVNFSAGDVWKDEHNGCWIANIEEVGTGNNHVAAQAVSRDIDEVERRRDVMLAALISLAPPPPVEDVSTKSPETNMSPEHVKEMTENEHVAAPVEASGAERDTALSILQTAVRSFDSGDTTNLNGVLDDILDALRPQPSGETREALDRLKMAAHVYEDDEMAADCATLEALLSARPAPVASGGQHSSGSHPCYDEHRPGCDCVIAEQTASPMPSYLERLTAPVAETAGEAVDYDLPITDYTPSVSGLSDYLWNQEQAAESIEDRCIFEQWREAIDALKATKLVAINPEQWTPCSPEWLDVHPRGCSEAPRVAAETWDGHSHYHPVNWPVPAQDDDKLRIAVEALEPFREAARMAEISGHPPFEFCDASDYQRAASASLSLKTEVQP